MCFNFTQMDKLTYSAMILKCSVDVELVPSSLHSPWSWQITKCSRSSLSKKMNQYTTSNIKVKKLIFCIPIIMDHEQ